MGEEFYCVLKLVSGEEVFSVVSVDETTDDTLLILQNPVVMNMIQSSNGNSYLKIKPWMELVDEDIFILRLDKVITMTETEDQKLISIYRNYLSNDIELHMPGGEVKVTNKMGYLSSVEEARKSLEKIFKDIKES
jgi:hypothetical protein